MRILNAIRFTFIAHWMFWKLVWRNSVEGELQPKDIGKLWGAIKEIRTALIGLDGTNGLRGEFREFAERMEKKQEELEAQMQAREVWERELEEQLQLYLNKTRKDTCEGIKALKDYEARLEQEERQEKEDRRDRQNMSLELKKMRTTMLVSIACVVITVLGSITVALINVNKGANNGSLRVIQQGSSGPVDNSRP